MWAVAATVSSTVILVPATVTTFRLRLGIRVGICFRVRGGPRLVFQLLSVRLGVCFEGVHKIGKVFQAFLLAFLVVLLSQKRVPFVAVHLALVFVIILTADGVDCIENLEVSAMRGD